MATGWWASVDAGGVSADESDPSARAAPVIASASRRVPEGGTITLLGDGLADVTIEARIDGPWRSIPRYRADDRLVQAQLPDLDGDLATTHPTTWVRAVRGDVLSEPIAINRPQAWWVWPCRVDNAGEPRTLRVFGLNLDGVEAPRARLRDASGVDHDVAAEGVSPYEAVVDVQGDWPVGESTLRVHNGTGGPEAWSEPAVFEFVEPSPPTPKVVAVELADREPGDAIDQALHHAIEAVRAAGGGEVRLPAGDWRLELPLTLPDDVALTLRGAGRPADWSPDAGVSAGDRQTVLRYAGPRDALTLPGAGHRVVDLAVIHEGAGNGGCLRLRGRDMRVAGVLLVRVEPTRQLACLEVEASRRANIEVIDSVIHAPEMAVRVNRGGSHVRVSDCELIGHFRGGNGTSANALAGHTRRVIFERCTVRSFDPGATPPRVFARPVLLHGGQVRECVVNGIHAIDVGPHPDIPGINANTSESFLIHHVTNNAASQRIESASATRATLDTAPRWGRGLRFVMAIQTGPGTGQLRDVARGETANEIVWDRPLRVPPSPGDRVSVFPALRRNLVIGNRVDRTDSASPEARRQLVSGGVSLWLGSVETVIADNRLGGATLAYLTSAPDLPGMWNLIEGNRLDNDGPGLAVTYTARPPYGDATSIAAPASIGDAFRGNRIGTGGRAFFLGWFKHQTRLMPSDLRDYAGLVGAVIENNELRVGRRVGSAAPPMPGLVYRANPVANVNGQPLPLSFLLPYLLQDRLIDPEPLPPPAPREAPDVVD
ncbi:MAG: hypothetical protein AAFY08_03375 [Planctomycetota bacterium]